MKMANDIISKKLQKYNPQSLEQEENALKEILQEIALFSLSTTDFFTKALFHGGTALRILHNLPRFSEDLDFQLKKPDKKFHWEPYVDKMKKGFELYDIEPEITDRSKESTIVQKLFLKDNSIGKILHLNFHHHAHRKLMIKFEIDTNPPAGSVEERCYLSFPVDYSVAAHDLPTCFAGKCHAILCREYLKGRDWFDFAWYVSQEIKINFDFFQKGMIQNSAYQNQKIQFDQSWLIDALNNKVETVDFKAAAKEVMEFANEEYKSSLLIWNKDFFRDKVKKLGNYL